MRNFLYSRWIIYVCQLDIRDNVSDESHPVPELWHLSSNAWLSPLTALTCYAFEVGIQEISRWDVSGIASWVPRILMYKEETLPSCSPAKVLTRNIQISLLDWKWKVCDDRRRRRPYLRLTRWLNQIFRSWFSNFHASKLNAFNHPLRNRNLITN